MVKHDTTGKCLPVLQSIPLITHIWVIVNRWWVAWPTEADNLYMENAGSLWDRDGLSTLKALVWCSPKQSLDDKVFCLGQHYLQQEDGFSGSAGTWLQNRSNPHIYSWVVSVTVLLWSSNRREWRWDFLSTTTALAAGTEFLEALAWLGAEQDQHISFNTPCMVEGTIAGSILIEQIIFYHCRSISNSVNLSHSLPGK